jgi:hypothetical protein
MIDGSSHFRLLLPRSYAGALRVLDSAPGSKLLSTNPLALIVHELQVIAAAVSDSRNITKYMMGCCATSWQQLT